MNDADVASAFDRRLPVAARPIVAAARSLAEKAGWPLYAVGGCVRDALLGRSFLDVDLALEGDAIWLAEALAARFGLSVRRYDRFLTATLAADNVVIDLATARRERYPRPGALPVVEPAPMSDDLCRRDFTINAMALRLTGGPRLLDPFGGREDAARRLVRVLHERSFQDDATRICRAVRYAARLQFDMEARTLTLLRRDRPFLQTISGGRILHELDLMLADAASVDALTLGAKLGVLRAIHPALKLPTRLREALAERPQDVPLLPFGLAVLLRDAHRAAIRSCSARLGYRGPGARSLLDLPAVCRVLRVLSDSMTPSRVAALLDPLAVTAVAAAALTAPDGLARDLALRYLREWRHQRPLLDGKSLRALGVPRGPAIGEVLRLLRDARLDGRVRDRSGEERLVRSFIERSAIT